MSVVIPPHLVTDATRGLAWSALPNAPVEPDDPPPRRRVRGFLRAAFRAVFRKPASTPAGTPPARPAPLRPQADRC
ncbi:MAG: hypothetical protein ACRDSK_01230 [Actinophytocola sp.]|uniref:hypothetical protein n=1 Tax=Actinophytocola sp. TaxID=1872138 RepID=UPI003D6A482A